MQSVRIYCAMSSAGVVGGWSTLFQQIQNQHSCLPGDQVRIPSVEKLYGDAGFLFD